MGPGRGGLRPVGGPLPVATEASERVSDEADSSGERAVEVGPWSRRSRRIAYENAWITVLHDEVTRPDGSPGIYGVVHFRGRAVGVVALDETGRILLVGQHRYTLDAYSWELPEGGVPEDEDLLEGARRELEEETGFTAARWRQLVPSLHLSNSVTDEAGTLFLADGLTAGVARPDPTERIELRWVTLDEALAAIDAGEITDSMTQLGILRYALAALKGDASA
ncbi:MAG TPA: NUDIX hydrolase [Candidatus Dormibacteraeota bacterium]|nr:NUDIX hydrolase [Candidatus Dormibacteraeota bacterium]